MTPETAPHPERSFTRDRLPWVIAAGALLVYLVTLNHSVVLNNIALVTKVSGWDWQPPISQPLLYLATLPFRLLPHAWVPLALNLFTAICAALTLMNLARSVALLPHNRVEAQRALIQDPVGLLAQPNAWVPVVLATLALGLQLTFWEHAIAASGEMLDLLLFAYVIRCLLEHRLRGQQSWLDRAAVVYGLAMANNWGMAGFLPVFLLAVIRTKRLSFFNLRTVQRIDRDGWQKVKPALRTDLRFFLRMTLLGLAGLTPFLIVPLVNALTPDSALGFWQALSAAATIYESPVHLFARVFLRIHRELALLLIASSLLPIFLLSIRWGSLGTREGPGQIDLASYILHVAHAFLLLLCLWVMFDPPFSPRQIATQNGLPVFFLPLYYLAAVSIGYYSGFFILLFGPLALQRTSRRHTTRRILCRTVPVLVYVLAVLTVGGLLLVNVRAIRAANAPHLDRYAKLAAGSLPSEGAVLFSEDPVRLSLVLAELAREGKDSRFVPVDTRVLPQEPYRAWLHRKYPDRWPKPGSETPSPLTSVSASPTNGPLDAVGVVHLLSTVAQSNRVYWLQPNIGLTWEQFYLRPRGLIQEMKAYSTNWVGLTADELAENQAFWRGAIDTAVKPVLQLASRANLPRPEFEQELMNRGHLRTPPPPQIKILAWWYSAALNRWGVTLQRNEHFSEATPCFTLAKELKPDNLPAALNLQCNSNLLAHAKMTVARTTDFEEQLSRYRNLNQVLSENGPIDEPTYCFQLGLGFFRSRMVRQGAQQMERVQQLVPNDLKVRLMLGDFYITGGIPEQALRIIAQARADPRFRPLGTTNETELAFLEARAWYALTNAPKATGIIYALLAFHPGDTALQDRAAATFAAYRSYSDALRILDRQLQRHPENVTALNQKGTIFLLSGEASNAIPVFTRVLSLTNLYTARLNRSYAYLKTGQLDAAEADCQELLQAFPDAYRTYRGLAEIAEQRKDTNAAIRYYGQYLAQAEKDSDEARAIAARLAFLERSQQQ